MNVLDLFSGIGGFSLGLERAGMKTVAFCEIEPFPRAVLAKHWPEIICYDDVRTLTNDRLVSDGIEPIDIICGGFPCQDLSLSGDKAGMGEGTRSGLWSEIARLVGEIRPRFVIVENVTNLLSGPSQQPGGWFGRVLGDLAAFGYDAEWHCIPAGNVGAPHERDRIWLVAYPHEAQFEGGGISSGIYAQYAKLGDPCWGKDKPGMVRTLNGLPNQMDRVGALGNSVVPKIPEMIGRAIMALEKVA